MDDRFYKCMVCFTVFDDNNNIVKDIENINNEKLFFILCK